MIKKGVTSINQQDIQGQVTAELIAEDFLAYINEFHSYREPYDDPMDSWLYQLYADAKARRTYYDFKSQPYFSPSSANSCDRELYEKILRMPRDNDEPAPHRRRWTAIGTAIGDVIQRELLLGERHFKKLTGKNPAFTVARNDRGEPFFEDFVKTMKVVEHNGTQFSLFGTCDGVLLYKSPTGETLRVGLEIKSKQTTYAQTSTHSLREPKEDHVKQTICYSMMYNLDYYIILYVNASHKGWYMNEEEALKYPDIRAFGIYITEDMRNGVLDKFANVVKAVEKGTPPPLNLSKYGFNNFKEACAKSLTEEEVHTLEKEVVKIKASRLPVWLKQRYIMSLKDIKRLRSS